MAQVQNMPRDLREKSNDWYNYNFIERYWISQSRNPMLLRLPSHHAHVVSDSLVVKETLNGAESSDSQVLVINILLGPGFD